MDGNARTVGGDAPQLFHHAYRIRQMLQHMLQQNLIGFIVSKWPREFGEIMNHINAGKRRRIQIDKTWQNFMAAAQMNFLRR